MSFGGRFRDEEDDSRGRDRGQRRRGRPDDGFGPPPVQQGFPHTVQGRPFPSQRPSAAPPERSASGETVTATVKWYNPEKGFGFVHVEGRDKDPFLHASVLQSSRIQSVRQGATLVCEIAETQRGVSVLSIASVDDSTAEAVPGRTLAPHAYGADRGRTSDRPVSRRPVEIDRSLVASVKWYDAVRGFGFFSDPDSGNDLFVHASALQAAGLRFVSEGERYRVGVGRNARGPCVVSVERA